MTRAARPGPVRRRVSRGALPSLAAAVLLAVSACGGGAPSSGPTPDAPSGSADSNRAPLAYVALGDSYSAAPLVPTTDVADGCFRSSSNYPSLVARSLEARLVDRTCGGATTADLTRPQRPAIPAQDTALRPGTRLVTLGMGGNDEQVFSTLVQTCARLRSQDPTGAPCRAAMRTSGGDRLLLALGRTEDRLAAAVRAVERASPRAQVLLVGYPHIVAGGRSCAALPLAAGDYAWAEGVNRALTRAVKGAARRTGATYVDVWSASRGHDICSRDPWINGSVTDQRRALAFHPFAVEQRAVARLVEQAVQG
ncbi:MAG: hydrolase family protein [Marmoricola sp.]|nr:hydrolase family protein [Marmoricola sp.]